MIWSQCRFFFIKLVKSLGLLRPHDLHSWNMHAALLLWTIHSVGWNSFLFIRNLSLLFFFTCSPFLASSAPPNASYVLPISPHDSFLFAFSFWLNCRFVLVPLHHLIAHLCCIFLICLKERLIRFSFDSVSGTLFARVLYFTRYQVSTWLIAIANGKNWPHNFNWKATWLSFVCRDIRRMNDRYEKTNDVQNYWSITFCFRWCWIK